MSPERLQTLKNLLLQAGYPAAELDRSDIRIEERMTLRKFDGEYVEGATPMETIIVEPDGTVRRENENATAKRR